MKWQRCIKNEKKNEIKNYFEIAATEWLFWFDL